MSNDPSSIRSRPPGGYPPRHDGAQRPFRPRPKREREAGEALWLYGLHTVESALKNPRRKALRLLATRNAVQRLAERFEGGVLPLVAEEASVLRVAADIGLDVDRLARDMASPDVQADLDRTRALADIFGFVGTPGLVVGRTVLNGAIPYTLLRRIAEDESSIPVPVC